MAYRDGSTIHIELIWVNPQPVTAIDDLDGEGLVQLPEIDVLDAQAMALEQLRHREHGANPHLIGFAAGHREAAKSELWSDSQCFGTLAGHYQSSRCTIRHLRSVSCGDRSFAAMRIEMGLERGQPF